MHPDRRGSVREPLHLPVTLPDGSRGVTANASASGLALVLAPGAALPHWIKLEFRWPQAGLQFRALGEVVRSAPAAGGRLVAMRLHAPQLRRLG